MSTTNAYCEALGIQVPRLETARRSPDANHYSLLLVALLERGEPITLEEAAKRFEAAGVAPADRALASLKRCRPARPPIYRDGDLYALDPHDGEADLWAFRLGLRPPKGAPIQLVRPDPPDPHPLPSPDHPLSAEALTEAWRNGISSQWSAQRIAVCVLDAHAGAMRPDDVVAFVRARARWSRVSADSARCWRRGAPVRVRDDGRWELDRGHAALRAARQAVRDRIAMSRRWADARPDPAVVEANVRDFERKRRAHGELLARMRRVLLYAFPASQPEALVLVDVGRREIATFMGEEIGHASERLAGYDVIAAIDVRALLRAIGFDPGARRLGELGPPRKTRTLNRRGRTLRITTSLLVQGSCGISRPFGDAEVLRSYLRDGKHTRFRRRLEADARSLFALYQFGGLHGAVRLRWGFLDEWIPAPWIHRDEPTLNTLMQQAHELKLPLEIVAGSAPGWEDPWSRRQRVRIEKVEPGWGYWLVGEAGFEVDAGEVQLARVADPDRTLM